MQFNNHWLGLSHQDAVVNLIDPRTGEKTTKTFKVKKHGMSLNDKLGIVMSAALESFAEEINEMYDTMKLRQCGHLHQVAASLAKEKGLAELPEPVVEEKFLNLFGIPTIPSDRKLVDAPLSAPKPLASTGSTASPKQKTWTPPKNLTTAQAMLASTARLPKTGTTPTVITEEGQ